ncbi:hypothetical protein P8923_12200 [Bacillus atrophaeus]|uniref:hypothetical protein n=1 Tax=Bacillus atrophaeus TaxID=1452 RepID=UPI002DBEE503|nr:hypothetical protein [Bacillus atrophaeus]MEC0991677.1 hypothetical protein [Bacillus atrophaeus]
MKQYKKAKKISFFWRKHILSGADKAMQIRLVKPLYTKGSASLSNQEKSFM